MFWKHKQNKESFSLAHTRELIIDLHLPPIILQLFDGKVTDTIVTPHLSDWFKAPYRFVDRPVDELIRNYKVDRYIPFLSTYQSTFFAYDRITNSFVFYDVEQFNENELLYLTWDGLFVKDIIMWWELEWPNEEIIYIGDLLGLKHTKEVVDERMLWEEFGNSTTYSERLAWELSLVKRIDGSI